MKILICLLLILQILFITNSSFSYQLEKKNNDSIIANKKLQVGEELIYVVKYSLVKLGEVKLKITSKNIIKGNTYYNAIAFIDSYSGVPFVNLHQIYETKINQNFASSFFRGLVRGDKYTSYTEYFFDYENSKIKI